MPDTPTFGRYAEIPFAQMTPEQQEGYRALIEARGALGGPNKIFVHNPKLATHSKTETGPARGGTTTQSTTINSPR